MPILAISGKPGAQKLVYGFKLVQELRFHGYSTEVVALATPLYEEFTRAVDLLLEGVAPAIVVERERLGPRGLEFCELILSGEVGERHPFGYHRRNETVRRGLTLFGSGIRREQDEDYFVKRLLTTVDASPAAFSVLTDVRYPNEARAIGDAGGLVLRAEVVEEGDASGGYKYQAGREDPSECALDSYGDFFTYLAPGLCDRVELGKRILRYYELPHREETVR